MVITTILIFMALFTIVGAQSAYAYLDMGTGSYILQILAASLVAGLVAVQTFWSRIKNFFSKDKNEDDE